MTKPKEIHPDLSHDVYDKEWPIGMRPDGTLREVDPATGEVIGEEEQEGDDE
jgi:hypothetical protein